MKFLVVDDSLTMRRIITNELRTIGYRDVIEACNGKEGLEKLLAEGADFIITDWNMPVMNGLELTQAVRANERFKKTPILMVTLRGNSDDLIAAMKAGVNDYIFKPFTIRWLKEKIETILRQAATENA